MKSWKKFRRVFVSLRPDHRRPYGCCRCHRDHNHKGDACRCWEYKFIGDEISGTSYDVAHVKWGGGAKMPTLEEVRELLNNCTFMYGTYNGVEGDYVAGPNGNSIFLPFAGFRHYVDLHNEGNIGYFWSGTYNDVRYDYYAYNLFCYEDGGHWDYGNRDIGLSVRPVKEK